MNSGMFQVLAAILFGAAVMAISMYRLWKPSVECQEHKLKLPMGIEFEGCSIWGAIFFGGLFIFAVGIGLNRGGQDSAADVVPEISHFFIPTAFAFKKAPSCTNNKGWVYAGTGRYSSTWRFDVAEGRVPSDVGKVSTRLILVAKGRSHVRVNHYSALTATWMGKLARIRPPKVTCTLSSGQRVRVKEFVSVGRSRVWALVEVQ